MIRKPNILPNPSKGIAVERNSLNSLQALRAFAAVLVVVGHLFGEAKQMYKVDYDFTDFPWGCGVDLFFVISGFVMVYTNYGDFGKAGSWRLFILKRIIRIVPLYYIFTTLMILMVILFPHLLHTAKLDILQFASSYAFWPYARDDGTIRPILSLGWTLNYEMLFYFLFAALMFIRLHLAIPLIILLLAVSSLLGHLLDPQIIALKFWTNSIILEFALGMLVGLIYLRSGKFNDHFFWLPAIVAALGSFFVLRVASADIVHLPRFISWGLPAFLLVLVASVVLPRKIEDRIPAIFRFLGDSSYALYLCHPFVFGLIGIFWRELELVSPSYGWLFILVTFVSCCVVSMGIHMWLEGPLLKYMKNRWLGGAQKLRQTPKESPA